MFITLSENRLTHVISAPRVLECASRHLVVVFHDYRFNTPESGRTHYYLYRWVHVPFTGPCWHQGGCAGCSAPHRPATA